MAANRGDQLELAILIQEQREQTETRDESRQDVLRWVKRGKMALKRGESELASEAKRQAVLAKARFEAAELRIKELESQKRSLKRRVKERDLERGEHDTLRTEMTVEKYRLMGITPEEMELDDLSKRVEADDELRKLKGEPDPVPVPTAKVEAEPDPAQPAAAASTPQVTSEPRSPGMPITDDDANWLRAAVARSKDGAGNDLTTDDEALLEDLLNSE